MIPPIRGVVVGNACGFGKAAGGAGKAAAPRPAPAGGRVSGPPAGGPLPGRRPGNGAAATWALLKSGLRGCLPGQKLLQQCAYLRRLEQLRQALPVGEQGVYLFAVGAQGLQQAVQSAVLQLLLQFYGVAPQFARRDAQQDGKLFRGIAGRFGHFFIPPVPFCLKI